MSHIATEYRGYRIVWSDNGDEWVSYDAGKGISSPSLAKVKAAIDRIHLSERKASAVRVFEISDHSGDSKVESLIVEYLGPKMGSYWSGNGGQVEDHRVAVVAQRSGSSKKSRKEVELSSLMPDTPEAQAAFEAYHEKKVIADEARKRAKAAFAAIPRVDVGHIQPLVSLYERERADANAESDK